MRMSSLIKISLSHTLKGSSPELFTNVNITIDCVNALRDFVLYSQVDMLTDFSANQVEHA